MRPIYLELSAFGAFAEVQSIDFSSFATRGLFLVCGETGAGKTTVFDAISFALYGQMSGEIRDVKTIRSDYAPADVPTYVRLKFEYQGKPYAILRSPSYQRPKRRGEGFVLEKAGVELTLPDGQIQTDHRIVRETITQLLGLTYPQWKQVAMIAQGEFARSLHATNAERSEIFRSIFDTGVYDRLTAALKADEAALKKQGEQYLQAAAGFIGSVQGADNPLFAEFQEVARPQTPEAMQTAAEILHRLLETDLEKHALLSAEAAKYQQEIEASTSFLENAKKTNESIQAFHAAKEQLAHLQTQEESFCAQEAFLAKAEAAARDILPLRRQWEREHQLLQKLEQDIAAGQEFIAQSNDELERLSLALRTQKDREAEREQLAKEIGTIADQLAQYQIQETLSRAVDEKETQLASQKAALTAEQARQMEIEKQLTQNQTLMTAHQDAGAALAEQTAAVSRIQEDLAQLRQLCEDIDSYHAARDEYKALRKANQQAEQAHAALEAEYNTLRHSFILGQAGFLAAELEDGLPCPVCGATDHPNKALPLPETPTEAELNRLEKQFSASTKAVHQAALRLSEKAAAGSTLRSTILKAAQRHLPVEDTAAKPPTENTDAMQQIRNQLAETRQAREAELLLCQSAIQKHQQAVLVHQRAQKDAAALSDALKASRQREKAQAAQCAETDSQLSADKGKLAEITSQLSFDSLAAAQQKQKALQRALDDAKADLQAAEVAFDRFQKTVRHRQSLLEKNQQELPEAQKKAADALDEYQTRKTALFADDKDLAAHLISDEERQKQAEGVAQFKEAFLSAQAAADTLAKQAEGKTPHDIPQLTQALAQLKKHSQAKQAEVADQWAIYQSNRANAEKLTETLALLTAHEDRYMSVSRLARTCAGDLRGKERLTLENYVQRAYFNKILDFANMRLKTMTSGRFELLRKQKADDLRNNYALDLNVLDNYTGKPRDINSLSGGETFMASLALAFGLSDTIQMESGGLRIDTMFIDEGFGTLSADFLTAVIHTLTGLSAGDKLIGIISHVPELRENIDKQIIVRKKRSLGSTLELQT